MSVFAYAGLSAAFWADASRRFQGPPFCGNVVIDPYMLLLNVVGPLAALCTLGLTRLCVESRRWPDDAIAAMLIFVVTSAGLYSESRTLHDRGIPLGRVWWLL